MIIFNYFILFIFIKIIFCKLLFELINSFLYKVFMVSLLSFNFQKELYLIPLAVIFLLAEKIIIEDDKIKSNGEIFEKNQNYTIFLMYLGEFLSFFVYRITKCFSKEEEKKNEKIIIYSKDNINGFINFKNSGVSGKQMIYVLFSLLLCSLLDLFYNSKISDNINHFYKYEHLKIISLFTFCAFISRKLFFKNNFYSHHYLSLLIMIIIFPIELFSCFFSKIKTSYQEYLKIISFGFLRELCQCLQLCFEKYLNNDFFMSYYGLMFFEGIFGIAIIFIIEVIKFYCNITEFFLIDFNLFVQKKYYIYSIIFCLDLLFFNLIRIYIVCNCSLVHYVIIFCFYELIINIYSFIKHNFCVLQLFFSIISFILLLIVNSIFSEIIELNCCRLSEKVERNIENRNAIEAYKDSNNINSNDIINDNLRNDNMYLSVN